jgi:hypothetical protein
MSSREQNAGLTTLSVLLFAQVVCFFFLPIGLSRRKPIFFYILILLDAISLWLGLYGC